jgi:hypothetical protein
MYDGNKLIDTLRRPPGVLRRPGDGHHHRHELLPCRPIPLRPQRHCLRCNGKGRPQRRAPARRNHRHPVQEVYFLTTHIALSLSLSFLSTVAWFSYGYKCGKVPAHILELPFYYCTIFSIIKFFPFLFENSISILIKSRKKKTENLTISIVV